MQYQQYLTLVGSILDDPDPTAPYNNPVYLNYTRLGFSRMNRWYKTMVFSDAFTQAILRVKSPQHWILITEPWCGDAGPVVPSVVKIAGLNPLISYELQLRDSPPFLINSYLTNGGKSIPKLIARDANGHDLFTWGPRPAGAQRLVEELKAAGTHYEVVATEVQNWYNANKGAEFQQELLRLMTPSIP